MCQILTPPLVGRQGRGIRPSGRGRWCRRERRSRGSWRATERSNVGVQVGQLLLQPPDLPSEPPGHELLLCPEPAGPIQDALALAEVLLQGLDSFLEKLVLGQGLQVIYTWPLRHRRCRGSATRRLRRIFLLADGWRRLLAWALHSFVMGGRPCCTPCPPPGLRWWRSTLCRTT